MSETLYRKYQKHDKLPEGMELKIQVYYSLGGINYANYKNEARGYYLSVTPVKREHSNDFVVETSIGFSGVKTLLKEVKRKSKKALEEAMEQYEKDLPDLIEHVMSQKVEAIK